MSTAGTRTLLLQLGAVHTKLSLVTRRGPFWNEHWRSHKGVKDRRLRHDRIAALRSSIQAGLKRSMETHETLDFESLGLEKKTRPPQEYSQRRTNRRRGRPGSGTNTDRGSLPQVFDTGSSARTREAPPTVSSTSSPPINPVATLANPWNPVNGGKAVGHNGLQTLPKPLKYHPGQDFVPLSQPVKTPHHQPVQRSLALQSASITINGSPSQGSYVQKAKLSVPAYHGFPPFRIDKHSRHSKTSTKHVRHIPVNQQPGTQTAPSIPHPREPHRSRSPIIKTLAPQPTPTYLTQAHLPPTLLPHPQPLLLVLDLNGTLLYRNRNHSPGKPHPRPSLTPFLTYALTHHRVLIWSSAKPHNVHSLCSHLFTPPQRSLLLGIWARDTLGLTPAQYKDRVQVYKNLDRIWNDESLPQPPQTQSQTQSQSQTQAQAQSQSQSQSVGEGQQHWGQHNTLLIDDSALKASAQPYNHIEIPEFVKGGEKEGDGKDVLGKVVGYLEEARRWSDVSAFGRVRRFDIEGGWGWRWDERGGSAGGNSKEKVSEQSTTSDEDDDEDDEDYGGVSI
ncbi:hypothetical protein JMJ35_005025 [Cladonia borealis]|uniref:Mitochondrial import inner membrane translocase subunit TIM50 n=1 Tax=Cladonia borealis TaxID=184061 RepID=A0AA39R473_9LECA|nr:hypothetical protein JMJ35_005025 [Cladonia borealis]